MTQASVAAEFSEKVLHSEPLVLVDFWAPWCGPCRAAAPILKEAIAEIGDPPTVVNINVDTNPGWANCYGVKSIPTLVFFRDGLEVDRMSGVKPKSELQAWLKPLLEN